VNVEKRTERIRSKFEEVFRAGGEELTFVRAPGRVNLIGEHTDYNDGFVLPMAIDREIISAFQPRSDRLVSLYSYNFSSSCQFSLDEIAYEEKESWANYVKGVIYLFRERGIALRGMNMVLEGDISLGAGLSSSAAMEVVTALSLQSLNHFEWEPVETIKLCQRAENEFVGVNCGIMDQFVSLLGKRDKALFLDCRTLDYQLIPLPGEELKIVVCNTRVKRGLADSGYNKRREECEEGVSSLKKHLPHIKALRDVKETDFERYKGFLPGVIKKRCRHIIGENQRVLQSVSALEKNDFRKFGQLMNESHRSMRDEYEISCPELDLMVEIAWETEGVLGARMTGGGFGGCTVNLVEEKKVAEFKERISRRYREKTGISPEIYICRAEDGAGRIGE